MADATRVQRIRERAYGIWEGAGRPHGCDREHWLQAEAEIKKKDEGAGDPAAATAASPLVRKAAASAPRGTEKPRAVSARAGTRRKTVAAASGRLSQRGHRTEPKR